MSIPADLFSRFKRPASYEDAERAKTALNEIERRLEQNRREQKLISTVAKRHRDRGVDELCDLLVRDVTARKKGKR